jgi:hypothetical protein
MIGPKGSWAGLLALGCGAPTVDVAGAPTEERAAAGGAQHGGALVDLGEVRVEVRLLAQAGADGGALSAWVTDEAGDAVPAEAVSDPRAQVLVSGEVREVALTAASDGALGAPMAWRFGDDVEAVVTFVRDGEGFAAAVSGRAGLGWHDHTPLHGGEVVMIGHTHVELVVQDGRARFFVTDAQRRDVCEGVTGRASWGGAEVPLAGMEGGCGLEAASAPPSGERVTLSLTVAGEAVQAAFSARP